MSVINALEGWKLTNNRFVAFLDIMGFKDMVARSSHQEILEKLIGLSAIANTTKTKGWMKNNIHITIFSDSIIVFSKDDSYEAADIFIWVVRFLICRIIEFKMGVKGGIAFGELTVNPALQLYFGQPLIDAFQLEEELQYYGVVLHHTAEAKIIKLDSKIMPNFAVFPTKLRQGTISHMNLSWFSLANNVKDTGFDAKRLLNAIKLTVSGAPRRYIDNTVEAIAEMEKRYTPEAINEMIKSYK